MKFEKERIAVRMSALLIKKINDGLSDTEQLEFQEWLDQNETNRKIYEEFSSKQSMSNAIAGMERFKTAEALQRVNKRIGQKTIRLWPRISVAAAAIIVVTLGVWLYVASPKAEIGTMADAQDIAPGKQGATLTLANGKKIKLNEMGKGELAKEAGIVISKQADGQLIYVISSDESNEGTNQINTLSTAKGETYQVGLPDGSKVWLNAASSLTYATALNRQGERRVKLEGEAYFEVAKDKKHPFIVETSTQEVQVLGTHFNINSYTDEAVVATTLAEGAVKVSLVKSNVTQLLVPGQQSLTKNRTIEVTNANMEQVLDWKEGDFNLNHVDLKTAMRKIARWYNVEVVYDANISDGIEAGGWISRDKKLSEILKSIEAVGQVHFTIQGRKIIVHN